MMATTGSLDGVAGTGEVPHWDAIHEDVTCPLCRYNLRGLTQPRCPECGYRFTWPDVLDPRRRKHPYLFEHHPERNIWSFLRTAVGGFLPWRFWKSLHPVQRSAPRRLIAYWLVGALVYVLALGGVIVHAAAAEMSARNRSRAREIAILKNPPNAAVARQAAQIVARWGSIDAFAASPFFRPPLSFTNELRLLTRRRDVREGICLLLVISLSWPWVTYAALRIFWISMRRARVDSGHVLRCALYSFDLAFWVGVLMIGAESSLAVFGGWPTVRTFDSWMVVFAWVRIVAWLVGFVRLVTAYACYLRFDRPFGTVLAAQIIVALAELNVLAFFSIW